jgi:hypothetical protein
MITAYGDAETFVPSFGERCRGAAAQTNPLGLRIEMDMRVDAPQAPRISLGCLSPVMARFDACDVMSEIDG